MNSSNNTYNKPKGEYKFKGTSSGPRPDKDKYIAQLKQINSDINQKSDQNKDLVARLNELINQYKKDQNEIMLRRDEIDKIKSQMNDLVKQKSAFIGSGAKKSFSNNNNTNSQKNVQEKPQFKKVGNQNVRTSSDVQNDISKMEKLMMTSTLTLKEEKDMISKLDLLYNESKTLKQQEIKLAQAIAKETPSYPTKPNTTNTIEPNSTSLDRTAQLNEIDAELDKLRELKAELILQNENASKAKKIPNSSEIEQLKGEIKENKDIIGQLATERNQVKTQFREENEKFNQQRQKQTQERVEKEKEQKSQKEKEAKKRQIHNQLESLEDSPYQNDISKLQGLLGYFQKLMPDKLPKEADPKSSKGKTGKGKLLTIDHHTLQLFEQYQIALPKKEESYSSTLEKISEKLEEFKAKEHAHITIVEESKEDLKKQLKELET